MMFTDPVVTGDLTVMTSEGTTIAIKVQGSGTVTFALVED